MELIIQEIIQKISSSFEKELEKLIREKRDISEFILATKKTLDDIGVTLVAEALETIDNAYKNLPGPSRELDQNAQHDKIDLEGRRCKWQQEKILLWNKSWLL